MEMFLLNLGQGRHLLIPTETLISITDNEEGNGCTIRYFENTGQWGVHVENSELSLADTFGRYAAAVGVKGD